MSCSAGSRVAKREGMARERKERGVHVGCCWRAAVLQRQRPNANANGLNGWNEACGYRGAYRK